ncbi:MAG TPA: hypothetical protein DIW64_22245 [Cellvibrio sp.]|nr:hypothetical protein [Cellvibrio sp.]
MEVLIIVTGCIWMMRQSPIAYSNRLHLEGYSINFYFRQDEKKGPKPHVMRAINLLVYLLASCLPCSNAFYDELRALQLDDVFLS